MNQEAPKTNKIPDLQTIQSFAWKLIWTIFSAVLAVFSLTFAFHVIKYVVVNQYGFFSLVDTYAKLILSSWPAVILILGFILLLTQQDSISEFIKKRMTSIGADGIKAGNAEETALLLSKQKISTEQADQVPTNTATPSAPVITPTSSSVATPPATVPAITPAPTPSTPVTCPEGYVCTPVTPALTPTRDELVKHNLDLLKQVNFEKLYTAIFGTQIMLLDSLRKDTTGGIFYTVIASVYEQWRVTDDLLKKYPLNDYLNFLVSNGLIFSIEPSGIRKYLITDKGVEFLDYIEKNGYGKFKAH